jgi:hypothetical protein
MNRRLFIQRCLSGCGAAYLGYYGVKEFALGLQDPGLGVGFRNDAPAQLDQFSRPAAWSVPQGNLVRCDLCPHGCILGENHLVLEPAGHESLYLD